MLSHDTNDDKRDGEAAARPADTGTVNRVLRLLGCFAEQDRWGVNDLARAALA